MTDCGPDPAFAASPSSHSSVSRPSGLQSGVVTRLRSKTLFPYVENGNTIERVGYINPDGPVAADLIERLREALVAMTKHYVRLVNSGDAGFWNPEDEDVVKQARAAIAMEAREGRDGETRLDAKHDSAGPQDIAQNTSEAR